MLLITEVSHLSINVATDYLQPLAVNEIAIAKFTDKEY
jgi:hypothetical protein